MAVGVANHDGHFRFCFECLVHMLDIQIYQDKHINNSVLGKFQIMEEGANLALIQF